MRSWSVSLLLVCVASLSADPPKAPDIRDELKRQPSGPVSVAVRQRGART
jgi:hypothetical protein